MKTAIEKGKYKEAAQIAGKETLVVAGSAASMVYAATSIATKMATERLSQVDYAGLGQKAYSTSVSAYQAVAKLGMTFYSSLPSREQVAKTSGQLIKASGEFFEEMCGHGKDKSEEISAPTPSIRS